MYKEFFENDWFLEALKRLSVDQLDMFSEKWMTQGYLYTPQIKNDWLMLLQVKQEKLELYEL